MIKFESLDFHFEVEKQNRCYWTYLSEQHGNEKTPHIIRNEIGLIGLTVGDLLKHFYYTKGLNDFLPVKYRKISDDYEHNQSISKLNAEIIKLFEKLIRIETNAYNVRDVFGVYNHIKENFYVWNN